MKRRSVRTIDQYICIMVRNGRPSVDLSAKLVNTIQTEQFWLRLSKLDTQTSYDKMTTPIDFHGQGSGLNARHCC